MEEYYLNKNNNFIDGYYLSNLSICDELIDLFEKSNNKVVGKTTRDSGDEYPKFGDESFPNLQDEHLAAFKTKSEAQFAYDRLEGATNIYNNSLTNL